MQFRPRSFALLLVLAWTIGGSAAGCRDKPGTEDGGTEDVRVVRPSAVPVSSAQAPSSHAKASDGWTSFPGPVVEHEAKAGALVWAVLPTGDTWASAKLARTEFQKQTEGQVEVGPDARKVPSALVFEAQAAKEELPAGTPVLVHAMGGALPGRVVGTDGDKVEVRFVFLGDASEQTVAATDLIVLTETLEPGAPVVIEDARHGTLIHHGEASSWVLGWDGTVSSVDNGKIAPVRVKAKLAAQDAVRAVALGAFVPATILAVHDEGLRYDVKMDDGSEETLSFTEIQPKT